jgi:hypothetical protein
LRNEGVTMCMSLGQLTLRTTCWNSNATVQEIFLLDLKKLVSHFRSSKCEGLTAVSYEPSSFWTPFQPPSPSTYFTYKLPECYLSPMQLALSTLWTPYVQYDGYFSDRQQRQLIQVHTRFKNQFCLHYQFKSMTQLSVQLQFQSLSVYIILEGCIFSEVKTLTVEQQSVCVPFVYCTAWHN